MAIQKIGFIGGGNMACALITGIGKAMPDMSVAVSDPVGTKADARLFDHNAALVEWADLVFIAVKPHIVPIAMEQVRAVCADKPFVSIAAGVTTETLVAGLPGARVCRTMPNTPAMMGEGMTALSLSHSLTAEEFAFVKKLLGCVGQTVEVEEDLFAAVTAMSGSGPAYYFILIEAMADAAVLHGVPRALAYRLAAQTVVGAGVMARDSGLHPGALKDQVTSPHGTTIAAIDALEHANARSAMMDAVHAAYRRAREME